MCTGDGSSDEGVGGGPLGMGRTPDLLQRSFSLLCYLGTVWLFLNKAARFPTQEPAGIDFLHPLESVSAFCPLADGDVSLT